MTTNEIVELSNKISDALFAYRKAVNNGITVNQNREKIKNMLFNNMEAIEQALAKAAKDAKEVEVLTLELADAENELKEKDNEIKQLQESGGKKKKMPVIAGDEVEQPEASGA